MAGFLCYNLIAYLESVRTLFAPWSVAVAFLYFNLVEFDQIKSIKNPRLVGLKIFQTGGVRKFLDPGGYFFEGVGGLFFVPLPC